MSAEEQERKYGGRGDAPVRLLKQFERSYWPANVELEYDTRVLFDALHDLLRDGYERRLEPGQRVAWTNAALFGPRWVEVRRRAVEFLALTDHMPDIPVKRPEPN
jgi:hypothetical protein